MKIDTDDLRKAINFDLDTTSMKIELGEKNYTNGYTKVRRFLEHNGFKHVQHSGYRSIEPMTDTQVQRTFKAMVNQMPWLRNCAKEVHVTSVTDMYDLLNTVCSDYEDAHVFKKPPKRDHQITMSEYLSERSEAWKAERQEQDPQRDENTLNHGDGNPR